MTKQAPLQLIQDEQGYLIIGVSGRHYQAGELMPGFSCGRDYDPCNMPVLVIGGATPEEWIAQAVKYATRRPKNHGIYTQFVKVIAE